MAIQTFSGRIRQRFSTLAAITATNPILLEGEVWTEKDASTGRSTGRRKVGDGVIGAGDVITGTAFNSLPFEPTAGGGSGDVVGPASATDGRAALFDGATGKLLKVSGAAPVLEGDARLTDVRTPAAHNQAASTISDSTTAGRALLTAADATAQRTSLGLGTAATTASTDYAPAAQGVTNGNSHDHNGGDGAQIAYSSLSGLPTLGSLATLSALGAITSAGALGSTANLPIITTTGGALSAGSFGATANTFCQGNDSRLSDARTPTAHNQAWSTISGTPTTLTGYGISDAQPLDSDLTSIAALTTTTYGRSQLALADAAADTAQLNAFSSSLKGLAPASGGGTANFLRADGTWATPAGGGDAFRWFGAAEFIPRTTAGCGVNSDETATNRVNRDLLMFDAATQEHAQIWFAWPTGWNTFSATFLWKYSSATGNCVWGAQARLYADNTAQDTAFGTAVTVTDNGLGTAIHHESAATSAITPGGTVADGRTCALQIYRDAANGSDTLSVDAELIGVVLTKVT